MNKKSFSCGILIAMVALSSAMIFAGCGDDNSTSVNDTQPSSSVDIPGSSDDAKSSSSDKTETAISSSSSKEEKNAESSSSANGGKTAEQSSSSATKSLEEKLGKCEDNGLYEARHVQDDAGNWYSCYRGEWSEGMLDVEGPEWGRESLDYKTAQIVPSGTYDCSKYSCIPTDELNQELLAAGSYGEYLDERDNQVYKTIQIGEQVWMAQNLNYADSVEIPSLLGRSWCYDNNVENCKKTGRLYTWAAAVDSINYFKPFDPSKCEYTDGVCEFPGKNQGICPPGWHVPDTTDFRELYKSAKRDQLAIKTQQGWCNSSNGTNELGFSAIPVGTYSNNIYHCKDERCFNTAGGITAFWSVNPAEEKQAYAMGVDTLVLDLVYKTKIGGDAGLSVRCIKNKFY